MATSGLFEFIVESNRIEGFLRTPTADELTAHVVFLSRPYIALDDLEGFVATVAARPLRRAAGQNVRVGSHRPPPGGPAIERELAFLVEDANLGHRSPFEVHVDYELLHPFLDGNGRSGRVLWAWMMRRQGHDPFAVPFLHRFYYQALDAARSPDA